MIGSDFLYAMLVFAVISMVAASVIYVSINIGPALLSIPGYNSAFTPQISNGVVCQTVNEVYLNNQSLTVNNVKTVNTICTVSYISQTPSNTVSWPSPFVATEQILANYNSVDKWLFFMFILINLAIIASIAFLPAPSPMAIAIGFIMLIILGIVSMILSNAINVFFNVPLLANAVAKLPQTRELWATVTEYEILFSFIYLIVVAARSRGGGGNYSGGQSARAIL